LIYPLEQLLKDGCEVKGLFYNPNIHSFLEFNNRKQALINFSESLNFEIDIPEYDPSDFFGYTGDSWLKSSRCFFCWNLRLKKTAKLAKEKGFSHFSTTLLVSPYQDHQMLKEIGFTIARQEGVDFYYQDFRVGFSPAQARAREKGLYMQKYCGCIYSEIERSKEKINARIR